MTVRKLSLFKSLACDNFNEKNAIRAHKLPKRRLTKKKKNNNSVTIKKSPNVAKVAQNVSIMTTAPPVIY